MQISCEFESDFFDKRPHYCTKIAPQKSYENPANRRAASDEKPTPVLVLGTCTWYLSTYLSVLDVLEYLVYRNVKVLVLVLVLDKKVLGT